MAKLNLKNITLVGIDTMDSKRLHKAFRICESYADFGDKKLFTAGVSEKDYITESGIKVIHTKQINSLEDYCYFTIKKLNDFIDTPFILIIQYDGFILNPKAWTDEFLKYDYVGAPWWYQDDNNVGNGGFSLRSKKLLELLEKDENIKEYHPEDHIICRIYGDYLKQKGIKFAPEKLASKFSIEGALLDPDLPVKFGSIWNGEFGFHGFDKTDISKWKGFKNFKDNQQKI